MSRTDHRSPVVLIGPMAAGKSAVGHALRDAHGYQLVDSDARLVAAHGTIPEIFAAHGEACFRELEASTVEEIFAEHRRGTQGPGTGTAGRLLISLGGGAPMTPAVRELLAREAQVVYLLVDEQTVADRIRQEGDRPLLVGDPLGHWRKMFAHRHRTYQELADLVVDARGTRTVGELADEIHRRLGSPQAAGGSHGKDTAQA